MNMQEHSLNVEWTYAVPLANCERVVIQQRQDGPFRADKIGEKGHYYVGLERVVAGTWEPVRGSARGGFPSFSMASEDAQGLWSERVRKAAMA